MADRTESISIRRLEWIEFALWLLLLAGAALAIMPWARGPYALPKTLWIETLCVALVCLELVFILQGRPFRLALAPALGALGAFAVWNWISVIWAGSRSLGFEQARFWLALAALAVLFQNAFHERPKRIRWLALAMLTSAALTALWALTDDFRGAFWPDSIHRAKLLPDWRGWIVAGLGNTSHIGDYMALAYPAAFIALMRARDATTKALGLVLLLLLYAGLIVCFSVHSNTGLILAMLVVLVLLWRRHDGQWFSQRAGRLALLAAGWGAIALFFALDLPGNPHRPGIFQQAFASDRLAAGWDTRLFIWLNTLEMVHQKIWLGCGSGNFEYFFPQTVSTLVSMGRFAAWQGSWTNAAHNSILQTWAELGIVGPVILFVLVVTVFQTLGGKTRDERGLEGDARIALIGALVAFVVHAQMNFPLQMPTGALMLALIVGLSVALKPPVPALDQLPNFCLDYDRFRIVFEMETFRRPRALRFEARPAPRLAFVAAIALCTPLTMASVYLVTQKQRSDIEYFAAAAARDQAYAYAAQYGAKSTLTQQAFRTANAHFVHAVELWPDHHDCRSAYSDMLVKQGRPAEALEQVDVVSERLFAWELYWRRAQAHWQLGEYEAAKTEARNAFDVMPAQAQIRPAVQMWLAGNGVGPNLEYELGIPRQ